MPTAGHWMTISEAKTHIMRAAGISRAMARRALAAAIAEREVEVRGVVKYIEARGSTGWSKGFLEEHAASTEGKETHRGALFVAKSDPHAVRPENPVGAPKRPVAVLFRAA